MSRSAKWRAGQVLRVLVTFNFSVLSYSAAAFPLIQSTPPEPPQLAKRPGVAQVMVLEVVLNNTETRELLTVQRAADGRFSASAGSLRRLRLKVAPALPADAMVRLDDLPGVAMHYDEPNQSLTLQVPDAMLESYDVELGGERSRVDPASMQPISSAILNYGVYDTFMGGRNHASASIEGLVTNRAGVFSTTALYNQNHADGYGGVVRLDSAWRYIDVQHVRSYTVGDFISNALSWTSSVRLAGFQLASAFEQRPDIVTAALPQFSGSAALPSTLDLYVNQQRVFAGEVPSGPYQLKSLPYVAGGNVTLLATDATGRQVSTTQAYYYNPQQLRQGLFEYSLDIGVPRLDYGTQSSNYDTTLFAAGTMRYGWTNTTTVEGHVESSGDGLANAGGGVVQGLGGYGTLGASFAGSRYKGYSGGQVAVNVEGLVGGVRLFASSQRTLNDYFDLARVSSYRQRRRGGLADTDATAYPIATAQASALDRAGLGFTPWFDETSVNLSYNRIKYANGRVRTANVSLSRSLGKRVSLFANAYDNLDNRKDHGVYLSVNVNFDHNVNAQAAISRTGDRTGYTQQVSGLAGQRQGDIGWGLSNTIYAGAPDARDAYISYRANQALLRAQVYQDGGATRTDLSAEGSLVMAGGGVFAANRIGNAYAIVTHAGPGAEVLQGGVRMGQANRNGRLLLPDLTPYYEQHVYLDPATLPDGWIPEVTERVAVAGFRQGTIIDFGAEAVHGAVLILHDRHGKPVAPGYTLQLQGGGTAMVGYDGQAYVSGLQPHNRISIDLGPAGTCSASFDYDMNGPAQPQIGPLTCQ